MVQFELRIGKQDRVSLVLSSKSLANLLNRLRHRWGGAIESGQFFRKPNNVCLPYGFVFDCIVQHSIRWQSFHLDQPLNNGTIPGEGQSPFPIQSERHNIKVYAWRQPAIQPQFLPAGEFTRRKSCKIEEFIMHRFLHLENQFTSKKDPCHMCFDNVYVVRTMGINSAIAQNSNLLGNFDGISIYDGGGQLGGPIGRLFAHINNAF